jgi:pyruvyltransferase
VKVCHWPGYQNVGDTLTPVILDWLGIPFEPVPVHTAGKLMGCGSLIQWAQANDVIWGSGFIAQSVYTPPSGLQVLAIRGKLSEHQLGRPVGIHGDPGLLLPLIYRPQIKKQHRIGVIPHYAELDEPLFDPKQLQREGKHHIFVGLPWKAFVDEILACETIISSSLHGIVIAEAYGVPAQWIKLTDKVIGDGFKFHDYYSGTGRDSSDQPLLDLPEIQNKLLTVLRTYWGRAENASQSQNRSAANSST